MQRLIWECLVEEVDIVNILQLLLWQNSWQIGLTQTCCHLWRYGVLFSWHSLTFCLCLHLSSHLSEAQKSVNSRLFARLRDFSLTIIRMTGMLFEPAFLNQLKTALSRSLLSLFFNFFRLEFTEVWNFWVTKSSYKTGLRKMTSHFQFQLLTRKFL